MSLGESGRDGARVTALKRSPPEKKTRRRSIDPRPPCLPEKQKRTHQSHNNNNDKSLVAHLLNEAKAAGCYKAILDCAERNVAYYERLGMARKEVQMARYF